MIPPERIGRYRLVSEIGRGAMGAVYRAHDPQLERDVAVKLISLAFAAGHGDPKEAAARFAREARVAARLHHPNVVTVFDFGEEGDQLYLVMELVEGETLRSMLKRLKRFPPHGVADIAAQIAEALACAHSFGVVHRDLKPENVLVSWPAPDKPWIKVLDFGMARLLVGAPGTPLTRKGAVFGTPEYMPPEQCMGQPVDTRADQYAFGVMAFEMLAGERPFKAKSALEMVQMQIRTAPPSLASLAPDVPPAAAEVVAKMLAKKADERFPDVTAAARALTAALGHPKMG